MINHRDASESEDKDEWDWRSMLEDDDKYCTTSDNDELVTTYYTCELHHCCNCNYYFTLQLFHTYIPRQLPR